MEGNTYALKYKDVESLQNGIDNYFKDCDKRKLPYTIGGLADALDVDRKTINNYQDREEFSPLIKKAKQKIERQLEENALMGKGNPTFTIFNLKNNYGWKDQQEIKTTSEVNISPLESAVEKLIESTHD